jgi:hypothetical protein
LVGRILRRLGFALAATATLAAQPGQAAQPQRIVAVGDLHGDYNAWRQIALRAHLIDRRNHWAGGSTVLVQAGDIVDRGPDSLKIIRSLRKLQAEAPRSGGRVVVLVGNHEAMNMIGDLRYVDPGEFAAFANAKSMPLRERVYEANKAQLVAAYRARSPAMSDQAIHDAWIAQNPIGKLEHQAAWSPTGELGRWTIANPAVAKIGDTVFVHGGISVRYAAIPIDEINRRTAAALTARTDTPDSILNDQLGPLWYRGLITRSSDFATQGVSPERPSPARAPAYPSIDDELATVLRSTGASRLVIAHTPILSGIQVSHGGRLVRIDTGISRFYGGKLSYLEILGDRVVPHNFGRSPPAAR